MDPDHRLNELAGIIGGVGPEATNYFTSLLVKLRGQVRYDQDHIPYLLFNNPQIPDRSQYLMYGGENPLPEMIHSGLLLKKAGATFLVIPCNTAHAFVAQLQEEVGLPVINMIDVTAQYIADRYGRKVRVGLLATTGTVMSRLYQNSFKKIASNIKVIIPNEKTQEKVMKATYEIKRFSVDNYSIETLTAAAKELTAKGASVIILGCTEFPLALTKETGNFVYIDPMVVLAKLVIKKSLTHKKFSQQKKLPKPVEFISAT